MQIFTPFFLRHSIITFVIFFTGLQVGLSQIYSNPTNDSPICNGSTVSLTGSYYGSESSPVGYLWSTGATTANTTATPTSDTWYRLTVSDSYGLSVDSTQVIVVPIDIASLAGLNASYCLGNLCDTLSFIPGGGNKGSTGGLTGDLFCPDDAGIGNHKVWYSFSNSAGTNLTVFEDDFSINRGWTGYGGNGGWGRGKAKQSSGCLTSNGPSNDYTTSSNDSMILGSFLGACYNPNINDMYYITSPYINCSKLNTALVNFKVWWGCGGTPNDSLSFEIYNQTTGAWVKLWNNYNFGFAITDWQDYASQGGNSNITPYAAGRDSVRLRFGIGPTDGTNHYIGWNIDDFKVTGNAFSNCVSSDTLYTVVYDSASVSAGGDKQICVGGNVTLTATAAGATFLWSEGGQTTASINVAPVMTSTYTVTATVAGGCTDVDEVVVTVYNKPTVNLGPNDTICDGETDILVDLNWALSRSYEWTGGATTDSLSVTPSADQTYTVTATDGNGCTNTDNILVMVNASPTANTNGSAVCINEAASLTATPSVGATRYKWSTGATAHTINVNPALASATYTVTVYNDNDCSDTENAVLTVHSAPASTISSDTTICKSANATLVAGGGVSYNWNTGATTATIVVSPAVNTTYNVAITDGNGCTATEDVVVFVNGLPTANAGNDTTVCSGTDVTLNATGGLTYEWSTGATTESIVANQTNTTTYLVTTTDINGCSDDDAVTVNVFALPLADAGADTTFCLGDCGSRTATGGITYLWSTGSTDATLVGCPVVDSAYWVTVTDVNGCSAIDTFRVTVNPVPTAVIIGGDTGVCAGASVSKMSYGGLLYSWSSGQATPAMSVVPVADGAYTVTVMDGSGCSDSDDFNVVVYANPSVEAGDNDTICDGNGTTLIASGANSYLWSVPSTSNPVAVTPTATITYTVTGVNLNNCTDIDSVVVVVTVNTNANLDDVGICPGGSAILVPTGGVSYSWSTGETTGTILVSPTVTTTYRITASDGYGCTDSDEGVVTLGAGLAISHSPDRIICRGDTVKLWASGALNYSWSTFATTAVINVMPLVSTTYTVTANDGTGCTDTEEVIVTVNELPTANAGAYAPICAGTSQWLIATGAGAGGSYRWSTGTLNDSTLVTPLNTTTYTVTVTKLGGCFDTDQVVLTVNPVPDARIWDDVSVCPMGLATMAATGGGTYQWSHGLGTNDSVMVGPILSTRTYTVTVTKNGCTATDEAVVTMSMTMVASAWPDTAICRGDTVQLGASGGIGYRWSTQQTLSDSTLYNPLAYPTTTTTYQVATTDGICTDTTSVVVTIKPTPTANAGSDDEICLGETGSLTGDVLGAVSFQWNTGETTAGISKSPGATTTYTISGINALGCSDEDDAVIIVNPNPTANTFAASNPICETHGTWIWATGGDSYLWSTGGTPDSVFVSPSVTTTYTVTTTTTKGCTDTGSIVINVNPVPTANAGSDTTICLGATVILDASSSLIGGAGPIKYNWSTGETVVSGNVSPVVSTTYTVTVTDQSCNCTHSDEVVVSLFVQPVADAGNDTSVCRGSNVVRTATGGVSYAWNIFVSAPTISVNPVVKTTYTVTVTDINGCTDADDFVIDTLRIPNASAGTDKEICDGKSTTLSGSGAGGGGSYAWSTGDGIPSILVSPGSTATYTVTVTTINGCTDSETVKVTVYGRPIIDLGSDSSAICAGGCTSLNASPSGGDGSYAFLWSTTETVNPISACPASDSTYYVTVTDGNTCSSMDSIVVYIDTELHPVVPNRNVCMGNTVLMSSSGGNVWTWSPSTFLDDSTKQNPVCTPTTTTTYTLFVTDSVTGCTGDTTAVVTVNPLPTANTVENDSICKGGIGQLIASGAGADHYLWAGGQTTDSIFISPGMTSRYSVTVYSIHNCIDTTSGLLVVKPDPTAFAGNDTAMCRNQLMVLTASGGVSYTWNTGSGSDTTHVSPISSRYYKVSVVGVNSCTSKDSVLVTVNPLPTANAGSDDNVCWGSSYTLVAGGAGGGGSYAWSTGDGSASSVVTPLINTTYTVTATTVVGCTDDDQVVITVNALPVVSAGGNQEVCFGDSVALVASGAVTYLWAGPVANDTLWASPLVNTTYTVTGTNLNGCSNTDEVAVDVATLPVADAGLPAVICLGDSTQLTASGGTGYNWSAGAGTTASVWVTPLATATYTVTVSNASGCSATDAVDVTVNPLPTAGIAGNADLCLGAGDTLTASGGNTYIWSSGSTKTMITFSPVANVTYTVTAIDANGCKDAEQFAVTVHALPVAVIDSIDGHVCQGEASRLVGSGAGGGSYQWSDASSNDTLATYPVWSAVYSLTITDNFGCTDTEEISVTGWPNPEANAGGDAGVCTGTRASLTGSVNNGVPSYTFIWSTPDTNQTTLTNPVFVTTTYTLTVIDGHGCSDSDDIVLTPGSTMSVSTFPEDGDTNICVGGSFQMLANGGQVYAWSPGSDLEWPNVQNPIAYPTVQTTYAVTVTDTIAGCTGTAEIVIAVDPLPTVNAGADDTICAGQSSMLIATGNGLTYDWPGVGANDTVVVTPLATTTYVVIVRDNNLLCEGYDTVVVVVSATVDAVINGPGAVCLGESVILTASGGGDTYLWDGGDTSASITAAPLSDETYTVTLTNATTGCSDTDNHVVVVNSLPTANAGSDDSVCVGGSVTLSGSGSLGASLTYIWPGPDTSVTTAVSPLINATYTVTVSDVNACTDVDEVVVLVNSLPAAVADGDAICLGGSAALTATGGVSYVWNTMATTAAISPSPVASTTYTVTVANAGGCTASDTAVVTVNTLPVVDVQDSMGVCAGGGTAVIARVTGGTRPYTYEWSTVEADTFIVLTNILVRTTYTVTVTDDNGCTDMDDMFIYLDTVITPPAMSDDSICAGESIMLLSGAGTSYSWTNGGSLSSDAVVNPVATPLITTTYEVTVSDTATGCTGSDDVVIKVNPMPTAAIAMDPDTICLGFTSQLIASGGDAFSWSGGQTTDTLVVSPVSDSTFSVTVSNVYGCEDQTAETVVVNTKPALTVSKDTSICKGAEVNIVAIGTGTFQWSNSKTTTAIDVSPAGSTVYRVTLTDVSGCTNSDQVVVAVNTLPTAEAGDSYEICQGDSAGTIASGAGIGGAYLWSTGETKDTIFGYPLVTSTYTVTVIDINGCTAIDSLTVVVNASPPASAGPDKSVCLGGSVTLNGSGGILYLWSTLQTTAAISVSPVTDSIFVIGVRDLKGCDNTDTVEVFVNPLPTVNVGPDREFCAGGPGTMVVAAATGGTGNYGYSWSTLEFTREITVTPGVETTYLVTVTDSLGCSDSDDVVITPVNTLSTVISPADTAICAGECVRLSTSGGDSYSWTPNATLSEGDTAAPLACPIATTTYTVTVTQLGGCSGSASVIVTVNTLPDAHASTGGSTVCMGDSILLTASGGNSYVWSGGETSASFYAWPTITSWYKVTATTLGGCTDVDSVEVPVYSPAGASLGEDDTICEGASVTLRPAGGVSFEWSDGSTLDSLVLTPSGDAVFTLTVTDVNGCTESDAIAVVVELIPTAMAGNDTAACAGMPFSLGASGAGSGGSYRWSDGGTGSPYTVTPVVTTTFTVTAFTAAGCWDTDEITVTVNPVPTVAASGDHGICAGASTTLTASGGISYSWSTGQTAASVLVTTTVTTTYVVTGTNAFGCLDTADVVITVFPTATVNAGPDAQICATATLTGFATGGLRPYTYEWSSGVTDSVATVTPLVKTTYTLSVTDDNGCISTDDAIVTPGGPIVPGITNDTALCAGGCVTLSASGGVTYTWAPSVGLDNPNVQVPVACPAVTTTYTVTVEDPIGACTATADVVLTINPVPTADAGPTDTICKGDTASLAGSGGLLYGWSGGQTSASIQPYPVLTTTYTLTVTNGFGCVGTDNTLVMVRPDPDVSLGADTAVCLGETVTLTANGTGSFIWSTTDTTTSIAVSPVATATYQVTITNEAGCTNSDNRVITVNSLPTADAGADDTICVGDMLVHAGSGAGPGGAFKWSNGQLADTAYLTPLRTRYYTLTVTDSKGCRASDSVRVVVNALPVADAGVHTAICQGDTAVLLASGGVTYAWSDGSTITKLAVHAGGTYTVTVADANGCTDDDQVLVTLNPAVVANAGDDVAVCFSGSTTLTINGAGGTPSFHYLWQDGNTNATITVSPLVTSTYFATVTDSKGCSDADEVVVGIDTKLKISITPDTSVCSGGAVRLIASGGVLYDWSPSAGLSGTSVSNPLAAPTATTTYVVVVDDDGVCTGTADVVVSVVVTPAANAGLDQEICQGDTASLFAAGGSTFLWNTGDAAAALKVNPSITATYTVTAYNGMCFDPDEVVVAVNQVPTVNTGPDAGICGSGSSKITASVSGGCNPFGFSWSTGSTVDTITVTPLAQTTYSVVVTDCKGCTDQDEVIIWIDTELKPSATPDKAICRNDTITLQANGGVSFIWSPSSSLIDNDVVQTPRANPTTTTTYVVSVSDGGTCTGTTDVVVTVNLLPDAEVLILGADSVCSGEATQLVAGGGLQYSWSNGMWSSLITVAPTTFTTYTVTVTDANGCRDWDQGVVAAFPYPSAYAGVSDTILNDTICLGESSTLKAFGGGSFIWSTGGTDGAITVSPTATTAYVVTVSGTLGCSDSAAAYVVLSKPVADAGFDTVLCPTYSILLHGSADVLNASGVTFLWDNLSSADTLRVQPSVDRYYTLTVTDKFGCSDQDDVQVRIQVSVPPVILSSGGKDTYCENEKPVLYLSERYYTYTWSSGSYTPTIKVNETGGYVVTVTDSLGCRLASPRRDIEIIDLPLAQFSYLAENVNVQFENLSLYSSSFGWNFGDGTSMSAQSDPYHLYAVAGSYRVVLTATNTCGSDKDSAMVVVDADRTGMAERDIMKGVMVYPNPVHSSVNVAFADLFGHEVTVELQGADGRIIYSERLGSGMRAFEVSLDMSMQPTGLYLLKLTLDDRVVTRKVVKQ